MACATQDRQLPKLQNLGPNGVRRLLLWYGSGQSLSASVEAPEINHPMASVCHASAPFPLHPSHTQISALTFHTHTHTHITECEGARRTPILHKILHFVVEQSQADANNLPIYPLWATLEKGLGG